MGTLTLAAPLVLFEKSRLWAGTGFHLLPSFHHHPTQHNYTTQTVTLTVTLTSTSYSTLYSPTHNVVCPSSAWIENRPYSTPSICLVRNPKHVIVQWVGIRTHTHNVFFFYFRVTLRVKEVLQLSKNSTSIFFYSTSLPQSKNVF